MNKIKSYFSRKFKYLLTIISPKLNTAIVFLWTHKKYPNFRNPKSFHEKLCYLKLYSYPKNQLAIKCSDKVRVREYVNECKLGNLLNEMIAIYKDPKEINWNDLPNRFVIKWNFGSTFNIICENKFSFNSKKSIIQLKKWKKRRSHLSSAEFHSRVIEKKLICEEYLDDAFEKSLVDYKAYCFNGEPKVILVIFNRFNNKKAVFMDPEWNVIGTSKNYNNTKFLPKKPNNLDVFLNAARILSKPFDFVRVDFYYTTKGWKFGELTFTPGGSVTASSIDVNGKNMGELLKITDLTLGEQTGIK